MADMNSAAARSRRAQREATSSKRASGSSSRSPNSSRSWRERGSGRSAGARRAPRRRPGPGRGGRATRAASRSAARAGRRRASSSGASRARGELGRRAPGRRRAAASARCSSAHDEAARSTRSGRRGEPVRGRGAARARAPRLAPARPSGRARRAARRRAPPRAGGGGRARRGRARSRTRSAAGRGADRARRRAGARAAPRSRRRSPRRASRAPLGASPRPARPAGRGAATSAATGAAAPSRRPAAAVRTASSAAGGSCDEQAHEPAAAALALARGRRLLLGVARRPTRPRARRCRRRSPRRARRSRPAARPAGDAGLDEAPPGEPRADAVGGEQRVEAAAGVELAAAEVRRRCRARSPASAARVGDQVDEAAERDLDAEPHDLAELALHRARVVGHLARDRGDRSRRPGRGSTGRSTSAASGGIAANGRGLQASAICHEATRIGALERMSQACERVRAYSLRVGLQAMTARAPLSQPRRGRRCRSSASSPRSCCSGTSWSTGATSRCWPSCTSITGYGVTLGFHRLLTHRSFQTYKPVEYTLGDPRLDGRPGPGHVVGRRPPQAPRAHRPGGRPALAARARQRLQGRDHGPLVRAHGLAVRPRRARPSTQRYARDLDEDRGMRFIHRTFLAVGAGRPR